MIFRCGLRKRNFETSYTLRKSHNIGGTGCVNSPLAARGNQDHAPGSRNPYLQFFYHAIFVYFRDGYRPVADHAAVLFFCISELVHIDAMYQFSLPWFISLYYKSIKSSPKRDEVQERIKDLKESFTLTIYQVGNSQFPINAKNYISPLSFTLLSPCRIYAAPCSRTTRWSSPSFCASASSQVVLVSFNRMPGHTS